MYDTRCSLRYPIGAVSGNGTGTGYQNLQLALYRQRHEINLT
jgi:hypothetical protein